MGSTYRYLSNKDENKEIFEWFSSYVVEKMESKGVTHFWFKEIGTLVYSDNEVIDQKKSPIVSVYPVKRVRGALLSVGEVHFLPEKMKDSFPELDSINRKFGSWLKKKELVFSNKSSFEGAWNYYLEGSVKNYSQEIYAFPSGLNLLKNGQYFVSDNDTKGMLETVCKKLALRGVECAESA
ncbi:hypothetical protein [Alkalimarinus coralli]|uniref:hypothetical protein n=1 Tax=Alkalimarinus coralli TaxID=2935863 RepID=UPI00202AC68E|nr:hypothetical protein [Alkalimarinus coralli]